MRVLVVGGGAREHAIADALARGGAQVVAVLKNRNPGITRLSLAHAAADETDVKTVVREARKWQPQLAVIGPEAPLSAGLSDALERAGIPCAAPTKAAAEVETNKAFLRSLMEKHNIPGAVRSRYFDSAAGLAQAVREFGAVAVKPVGLTGGKGVKVSGDHLATSDDAIAYAQKVLAERIGGGGVLIEEKLEGEEFTLQAFTDGTRVLPMPLVQDHKRAQEGDTGPNTGGMGSYSDSNGLLPFVTEGERDAALKMLERIVLALREEGREYRGAIYGQFMLTKDGPKVIEVNARLGDPEALNVLLLLSSGYPEICRAAAEGKLRTRVHFEERATVCKYVVPTGYGLDGAGANTPIQADEKAIEAQGAKAYWAAVSSGEGRITMSGSRALAVIAKAQTIGEAEQRVEQALRYVKGEVRVRHDIGTAALLLRRVEHMRAVRAG